MIKKFAATIAALAVLTLIGCAVSSEINFNDTADYISNETSASIEIDEANTYTSESTKNEDIENSVNSTVSAVDNELEETSASNNEPNEIVDFTEKVEEEKPNIFSSSTNDNTSAVSSKPIESTVASKPSATSSTNKPIESTNTPKSSSTTTTKSLGKSAGKTSSAIASKSSTSSSTKVETPVEKPVKTHNCDVDGHVWEVTTITTEPHWCQEWHYVYDFGFDDDLASQLYPELENPYITYKETLSAIGVDGACGSATTKVEVWGTETYEMKTCTECGHIVDGSNATTINPIGDWHYINNTNPRAKYYNDPNFNFNILFYDPYNVPQEVIDNITFYIDHLWDGF